MAAEPAWSLVYLSLFVAVLLGCAGCSRSEPPAPEVTQAQADARLALFEVDLQVMFEKVFDAQTGGRGFGRGDGFGGPNDGMGGPGGFGGPGRGHHGGFGGMFGGNGPQNAPAPEATVTPNA